jgi:hypothetical protein
MKDEDIIKKIREKIFENEHLIKKFNMIHEIDISNLLRKNNNDISAASEEYLNLQMSNNVRNLIETWILLKHLK